MKAGFTGTQAGMTNKQLEALEEKLSHPRVNEFHHGDCIGADKEAHGIAFSLGIPIVIHPPTNPSKRAFCSGYSIMCPPNPYLDRNHDNVDAVDLLIACPKESEEQLRSGTWATVRYARKRNREIWLILPSGEVLVQKSEAL